MFGGYRSATRDNAELIELWRIYDNLDQEAVKSDAAEMGYIRYKSYRRSGGNLIFRVEGGYVPSDFLRRDMQYAVIAPEDFHQDDPMSYNPRNAIAIGSEFDKRCVHTKEFVISEDYVDAFKRLPDCGFILPSVNGSVIQSKRRTTARRRILNGENPLLGLNLLLQSGDIVGVKGKDIPAVTDRLRKYIFGADKKRDFNDRQKEAIRIAVNTPDIAVIQGPPGTGKTQAIKAIVARINELENGAARILITSTQHDAVDNAVKGMSYSGVPVNRVFTGDRASSSDIPVFGWIDEMISACGDWLKRHTPGSATRELFLCLEALSSCAPEEAGSKTKELYHLLQREGYSGQLLAQVNETVVSLIDAAQPSSGKREASRLKELLDSQRLDVERFLSDGAQNLALLERYLKYDSEEVEFDIPPYWRQLRRAGPDTPELARMMADFQKDVAALRKQCGSNGEPEATGKAREHIAHLVTAVKAEMAERERDMTPEQTAYQQIWQFKHELSNIQNVKSLISSYSQVNAATCQQSANRNISPAMHGFQDIYDYVIIDEAARSNPLDLLIPMSMGKKIILVGDHKQLPHMVERDIVDAVVRKTKDEHAAQVLEESLFMRLFHRVREADARALTDPEHPVRLTRTCTLNEQYRMHSVICDLINVFYQDEKLKTACSDGEKQHNLGLYGNKPLAWLDMPPSQKHPYEKPGISKSRPCEVAVIRGELSKILAANTAFEVGIITFYGKQAELLKQMVEEEFPGDLHRVSVGTVDAFQGKEFDVVILSGVRSNRETELRRRVGFLSSDNRLCVAFSRAKRLLIMVGDSTTIANDGRQTVVGPLDELYQRCRQKEVGYYEAL